MKFAGSTKLHRKLGGYGPPSKVLAESEGGPYLAFFARCGKAIATELQGSADPDVRLKLQLQRKFAG
jgi:hypothetical protein